jgi:hypothetical protein
MYFQCPAGSETMCRMQWQDVRTIGTINTMCAGFGTRNVVTTATIRPEGTPLSSPDTWDLGMGVTPGVSIGNQCPAAKALKCESPSGTGGAGGVGGSTGAGGVGGSTGAGGSAGAGGSTSAGGSGGTAGSSGSAGTGGGPGGSGGAGAGGSNTSGAGGSQVLAPRSSNCALAPGDTAPGGWTIGISIAAVLAAATLRRRRRR